MYPILTDRPELAAETLTVASVHVANVPRAPSDYRMENFGSEGTLSVSHPISSKHGNLVVKVALAGSKGLDDLTVPDGFTRVSDDFPSGPPYTIGQMYTLFAEGIHTGTTPAGLPTFATAVELHSLLDVIRDASTRGETVLARLDR